MTVLQISLSPKDLLQAVENMDLVELDSFTEAVLIIQSRRKAPIADSTEDYLLDKIQNLTLSLSEQKRLQLLERNLKNKTITPEEHIEMTTLVTKSEDLNATCLEIANQLALYRQKPLEEVMKELDI